MTARRISLPLLDPADAIDQAQSRALQLLAKRCKLADSGHRGLIQVVSTLARHAVDACLAPASRPSHHHCLAEIRRWCQGPVVLKTKALRASVLEASLVAEAATASAVSHMLSSQAFDPVPRQQHAQRTIVRHARQASYYAASAVVITLDALDDPRQAVQVPAQVAGALAHKAVWTACANDPQLLREARKQATWWQERDAHGHSPDELELQFFHEFIGVSWKAQRDAQFSYLCAFVDWALHD